jgi:hypothetical protein
VQLLSSAVIGCAADIAVTAFNTGGLNRAFMQAGLGQFDPNSKSGKSALVSEVVAPALRAASQGDEGAQAALTEFVRIVAERIAPKSPAAEIAPGTPFWSLREATRSEGFDLRAEFSADAAARPTGVRLLPLAEPKMPLSQEITALEADFARLGLTVALNHYRQAVKNFVDQDFETANGALRTMLESVIIHFAVANGFHQTKQGDGGNAIAYLRDNGHLPERDGGDFIRGLWWITHTNGPHPGTTTAGEVHFRMLTLTGAARYLIDRFG